MKYDVTKIDIRTEKEFRYGLMSEEDMKLVVKGYSFNGMFYERKNSKYMIIVEAKEVQIMTIKTLKEIETRNSQHIKDWQKKNADG